MKINTREFLSMLDLTNDRVFDAALKGAQQAAEDLGNEADKIIPEDTGKLKSSKKVEVVADKGLNISASVTYSAIKRTKSGWNFDYAAYVHEMGSYNPTKPGTGPKFLETPLKKNQRRYIETIADSVRSELT